MTALPLPGRLLTVADYAGLPEDDQYRWELLEGNLIMSPSPTPRHNYASGRLLIALAPQLPADFVAIQDVDLDLGLAPAEQPGSARRPDLVVVDRSALDRVDRDGGLLSAHDAVLVVELVSPGSRRTDLVIKRGEYADAGIPHYWIVDLDAPVSLTACHLASGFGYQDPGALTGNYQVVAPFDVRIDLDALTGSTVV